MENQTGTPAETKAVEKAPKIEQNGVTRPKAGTTTGRIWEIADKISADNHAPADRGAVLKAAEAEQINAATAATQYGKWRAFHGIKGKTEEEKAAEKAQREAEKEAKRAEVKAQKDAEKAAKAAEKQAKKDAEKAAKEAAKAAEAKPDAGASDTQVAPQ